MRKGVFRVTALLCAAAMLLSALPAAASGEAEGYPAQTVLCTPAYDITPAEVPVLVMTEDPGRAGMSGADIAGEILYFPFDAETGLYASAGEPAGNRAEITQVSEDGRNYTARLSEPGKYLLSGMPYYALDPAVPALADLRAELEEAVEKSYGDTDKATAGKLHDWLCGRVSPALPEDRPELAEACADPMNALLTGYARREAYAPLYRMLMQTAGIPCLVVAGQAGEEEATWNLCRTDGTWGWTDCAADDAKDKKQKKYLLLDDAKMAKDHTLSAADTAFADSLIRTCPADRLMDGTLPFALAKVPNTSDRIMEIVYYDGPAVVVGDSATVTWHDISNQQRYRGADPTREAAINFLYYGWLPEDHYYSCSDHYLAPEPEKAPRVSNMSELLTVDEAAEDLSSFTVTFKKPGLYSFMNMVNFWLISPEETELVTLAESINQAVADAASPTEKETARKLLKWLCGKVAYDYSRGVDARSEVADYEPMTALLYGKCVCNGYAEAYSMLLQQAGIRSFVLAGDTRSGGHNWNLCRFDGKWNHTDPTWSDPGMKYFDFTPERIRKDHMEYTPWKTDTLFFGDVFSLWVKQFEEGFKPADIVPRALKTLPADIGGYGFPAQVPDFIRFVKGSKDEQTHQLVFELSRKAYFTNAVMMVGGERESETFRFGGMRNANRFSCPAATAMLRLRAASFDAYTAPKKPSVLSVAFYQDGEWLSRSYQYLVPLKKNEIRGYPANSYRIFAYDEEKHPVWSAWHLEGGAETKEIAVYFSPEGKAERYSVTVTRDGGEAVSWEGAADDTLLKLNGREVKDPGTVEAGAWEPVRFE